MYGLAGWLPIVAILATLTAAILGAVIGGGIAYRGQMKALQEGRRQREEDRLLRQQALAHSLLFKIAKIHTDFYAIHRHVEGCFEETAGNETLTEPWQIVRPIADPPDPMKFSSDEMGMLLALENDKAFNLIFSMETSHSHLIATVKLMNAERAALVDSLIPNGVEGYVVSGHLDGRQRSALRPRMIGLNSLIEPIRSGAKAQTEESLAALNCLQELFRDKLGIATKVTSIAEPSTTTPPPI